MASNRIIKWPKQVTTSLVQQLIRAEKNIEKAVIVFDSATAEYGNGFRHDHNTYGLIISRLLSANQFRLAEDMLDRMQTEKFNVTEDILLSFCRAYGRVHKLHDVMRIFQKMKEYKCEPTQKSYITVFAILVDENQSKVALRFYRYMREMGIPPSVTSLNILIKALCKDRATMDAAIRIFHEMPNHGCDPDSYTYGTLINGLCRLGKLSEAKALFSEMETKGCSPSVVTYTSLIHGLCQSNDLGGAMGLFEEMKGKNIEPNVYTYSCLMDGLCKGGCSSQAMKLLELMVSKRHKPNIVTYSSLIYGLCKELKLREAIDIFDRMKLQGLKPDAGLYSKIINAFCDAHRYQEAANFLEEMILEGITPRRLTWSLHIKMNNTVVRGLCSGNDHNRAGQLYLSMRTRGISVEVETFDSLVNCFCEKGDLQKATHIIEEMVVDGCIPDKGIWRAVVCEFWGRWKVQEAAKSVQLELMGEFVSGTSADNQC